MSFILLYYSIKIIWFDRNYFFSSFTLSISHNAQYIWGTYKHMFCECVMNQIQHVPFLKMIAHKNEPVQ